MTISVEDLIVGGEEAGDTVVGPVAWARYPPMFSLTNMARRVAATIVILQIIVHLPLRSANGSSWEDSVCHPASTVIVRNCFGYESNSTALICSAGGVAYLVRRARTRITRHRICQLVLWHDGPGQISTREVAQSTHGVDLEREMCEEAIGSMAEWVVVDGKAVVSTMEAEEEVRVTRVRSVDIIYRCAVIDLLRRRWRGGESVCPVLVRITDTERIVKNAPPRRTCVMRRDQQEFLSVVTLGEKIWEQGVAAGRATSPTLAKKREVLTRIPLAVATWHVALLSRVPPVAAMTNTRKGPQLT